MKIHLMVTACRPSVRHLLSVVRQNLPVASIHVHLDADIPLDGFPEHTVVTQSSELGVKGYAGVVTRLFSTAPDADIYLFLQDDIEPVRLEQLPLLWKSLPEGAAALYLLAEQGANCRTGWSPGFERYQIDEAIDHTGWLDCVAFAFSRSAMQSINRTVPDMPESRWKRNPRISSGVGQFLSQSWAPLGVYQVRRTAVRHRLFGSSIHPQRPFLEVPTSERVVARIATVAWRSHLIAGVISSLQDQVHELILYCSDCEPPHEIASLPWVTVIQGPNVGDRGRWEQVPSPAEFSYELCCDDDIIYPADYVSTLCSKLESHRSKVVVGVHSRTFRRNRPRRYFPETRVSHFSAAQRRDRWAHVLGTGTLAYHTDLIRPLPEDCESPNAADIFLARKLESMQVPRLSIARAKNWLRPMIGSQSISHDAIASNRFDAYVRRTYWQLPPLGITCGGSGNSDAAQVAQ